MHVHTLSMIEHICERQRQNIDRSNIENKIDLQNQSIDQKASTKQHRWKNIDEKTSMEKHRWKNIDQNTSAIRNID